MNFFILGPNFKKNAPFHSKIGKMSKMRDKRNFLIHSISGMWFSGSQNENSDEEQLTEDDISNYVFSGKPVRGHILMPEDFGIPTEQTWSLGYVEDIIMYYAVAPNEIWGYNPLASLIVGEPVYSPSTVFLTRSMLKGPKGPVMGNELFTTLVQTLINTLSQYTADTQQPRQTEAPAVSDGKPKPISKAYGLSDVKFLFAGGETVGVATGDDPNILDDFWVEHFSHRFPTELCTYNAKMLTDGRRETVNVFMRTGQLVVYNDRTGEVEGYGLPAYTPSADIDFVSELRKLYADYNMENLSKEESAKVDAGRQRIIEKFLNKIGS